MRKLSFPAAHTVLLIIAALTAGLTWMVPSGQFDRLAYDKEQNTFIQSGLEEDKVYAATQVSLNKLGVNIPLEKFTEGDIWKPVGIPNTYHKLESNPQGIKALIQSPLKGVMQAIDVILFVLIIGGFIVIYLLGISSLEGRLCKCSEDVSSARSIPSTISSSNFKSI